MKKQTVRPSTSYPPEFAQIAQHVINTGEPLRIDTLGTARPAYNTLRARWNAWRAAVRRERGESDPYVQNLDCLTISIPDPEAKPPFYALLRRKEENLAIALRGLVPASSPVIPQQTTSEEPEAAANTIGNLFGGADE